jgi:hypothetical protein
VCSLVTGHLIWSQLTIDSILEDVKMRKYINWCDNDESFVMAPTEEFSNALGYIGCSSHNDVVLTYAQ